MQGIALVIAFVVAIVLLILMISKFKVHPFLALITVSVLFAIVSGMPLLDIKEDGQVVQAGLVSSINGGFSSTFAGIGLVIIFGALIGSILEATGAAVTMAETVVKWVGPKHPELAMLIMGWIVSIPVFCDSGFVVLNPIRKALVQKTKASSVAMTVCLSAGLYASHVFIPPTPGPIAAAEALEVSNQLLLIMAMGAVVSIPALLVAYFYAKSIGKKITASDESANDGTQSYEELITSYGKLPSPMMSFAPIVCPILLMAIGSIAKVAGLSGDFGTFLAFLGTPVIALAIGVILGVVLIFQTGHGEEFQSLTEACLKTTGPILFITGAGGILGRVISNSGLIGFIKDNATALVSLGIIFPFLLSAILKTAQGSSTVALVTTASIMNPLMATMNLDSTFMRVLTVLAIGAGAMTVSHANDSYFWVVTNFGGLKAEEGYKTQTVVTLLEGIASAALIVVLWLIFR